MNKKSLENFNLILSELDNYDKSLKQIDSDFVYGTSGFRTDASLLHKVQN